MNRKQRRQAGRALITTHDQQIHERLMTGGRAGQVCVICGDSVNVSLYYYWSLKKYLCADCAEIRRKVYNEPFTLVRRG